MRLVKDLKRLVNEAGALFGGLPYERYLFLVHLSAGARGGLEHRASQSVALDPHAFRPEKAYREALLLFSHELFHAWNVKRIRPEAFGPFDYGREVYTVDLWALEGLTSYYEALLLVRAGLHHRGAGLRGVDEALEGASRDAGPPRPERRNGLLRHVDPLLPPGRELGERGGELLPPRRAPGPRARPDAPPRDGRPARPRRGLSAAVQDLRRERPRLPAGGFRGGGGASRSVASAGAALLRPLRARHRRRRISRGSSPSRV